MTNKEIAQVLRNNFDFNSREANDAIKLHKELIDRDSTVEMAANKIACAVNEAEEVEDEMDENEVEEIEEEQVVEEKSLDEMTPEELRAEIEKARRQLKRAKSKSSVPSFDNEDNPPPPDCFTVKQVADALELKDPTASSFCAAMHALGAFELAGRLRNAPRGRGKPVYRLTGNNPLDGLAEDLELPEKEEDSNE